MKPTIFLAIATTAALVSCTTTTDPEHTGYNNPQNPPTPQNPYGTSDPYGTVNANPYGVPGGNTAGGADTGRYTQQNPPGYQPLPGVPADPAGSRAGFPTIPSTGGATPVAPGRTTTHIVAKGETLWGLARKYGTSVEAIQQANNMGGTSSKIMYGTTILIPTN